MRLQTCKLVKAKRPVLAALLLGLWVSCGLLCADRTLGCDNSAAASSNADNACCKRHGSDANLPDREGQPEKASGTTCCDVVTKPAVATLERPAATDSGSRLEPLHPPIATISTDPMLHASPSALPDGRAFRVSPIQLLGVACLPHGPPTHA